MNNEQLQAAKDEAAREFGFSDWNDVVAEERLLQWTSQSLEVATNRAMEIYAEMVAVGFGVYLIDNLNTERVGQDEQQEYAKRYYEMFNNQFKPTKP